MKIICFSEQKLIDALSDGDYHARLKQLILTDSHWTNFAVH
jgi:hypothetical protein